MTARNIDRIEESRELIREADGTERTITAADYELDGRLQGDIDDRNAGGPASSYDVPVFALREDFDFTGGTLLLNGSRERNYLGDALTFTKRLANRWMMRGYFNYGKAEWSVPDDYLRNNDPNRALNGSDRDGALYLTGSSGAGRGARFLQATWTANVTGLYQIAPDRSWGFNFSGLLTAREGYPIPYFDEVATSDRNSRRVSVLDDLGAYRLPMVTTLDLRLEKEFNLAGPVNMTFGIDAFNVTNEGTAMSRNRDLSVSNVYWLNDNISPRIWRLGVRLSWK